MCISAKTVFLRSFLIFNILIIQRLESAKLHNPNEPASSKFISSLCRGWYGQVDNIAFLAKQLEPSAVIRIAEESTSDLYDLIEQKLMQQVEKKITHGYGNPNREVYDPTSVKYIAPVDYDKVDFYQPVDEKKKEKDEKTGKEKAITVTESYQPTTSVYVPTITAKYIAPVSTPYSIPSTTVKYIPPVTRPYSTKKTAVKYTKTYVPTKTEKPTTTTMMPYMPDVSEYDSINSVNIPEGPEGSLLADNYYPSPEEDEEDEDYI